MSGNSESMIEKVARAICKEIGINPDQVGGTWDGGCLPRDMPAWHMWDTTARAAIEAMREPSEAMLDTMAMRGDPEDLKWVYQQMIDAALSPTGPDDQSGDG